MVEIKLELAEDGHKIFITPSLFLFSDRYNSDLFLTCAAVYIKHGRQATLRATVSVTVNSYTLSWTIGDKEEKETCDSDVTCGRDGLRFEYTTERIKSPMLTNYFVEMELTDPEVETASCSASFAVIGIVTVTLLGNSYKTYTHT